MKLYKEVLHSKSFSLLKKLIKDPTLKHFYLAGGTSLALQIGHRESIDLDFFSPLPFQSNLIDMLGVKYETIGVHNNSIEVIVDGTKVFFFYFAFERLRDLKVIDGIRFSNPIDIGLMKLLAIQGRATKKDIIDLWFIDKEVLPLEDLLIIFNSFYPHERINSVESVKVLTDESMLNDQPMPKMLKPFDWDNNFKEVRDKFFKFISEKIHEDDI